MSDTPLSIKHVAIFLSNLGGSGGGAQRSLIHVANGLAARGIRTDLVAGTVEGPFRDEIDPAVQVVDLGVRRTLFSIPPLVRYLSKHKPEVFLSTLVHANTAAFIAHRTVRSRALLLLREATHVSLNSPLTNQNQMNVQRAVRWAYRFLPYMYKRADAVVAVSEGLADDLAENWGVPRSKVHVIYNPVLTRGWQQRCAEPSGHLWLDNTTHSLPVLLAVGRLWKQKDYPTLLSAFERVHAQVPSRLLILGEGPERGYIESEIQRRGLTDRVELAGFRPNPFAFMYRADVMVLSSAWEGLPGVLIQAMAAGCPVVSTDCRSGPSEILAEGKHGHLVQVGDDEAMARAIREVLSGDTRPAPAEWLQQFTSECVLKDYMALMVESLPDEAAA